jgi:hypothetical protein
MRWGENAECMVEVRNAYKILVRTPEEKRSLGRHRRRWKENIKIGHNEIGLESVG